MVCSCVVLSKCALLQIIFCSCVVVTTLSVQKWRVASGELSESDLNIKNKLGDRMIKQLSNSVIAKYCDLSMSRRSIICLSLRLRQIIDLLATDKSQYFAQPRPIIVKCREWVVRLVSRGYANLSGSKKGHSLDSLNPSKGKYNNWDNRESGITEKSHEIF